MSRLRARSSCEIVRHPLLCNQLIHRCEQIPGADFATHTVSAGASRRLPATTKPCARPPLPRREKHIPRKAAICIPGTYFNCRGSQSTPGSRSLAAWRTSSLSTEKLRRCPAWATATRIHSISGGSTMNGLRSTQTSVPRHTSSITVTGRDKQRAGGWECVRVHICGRMSIRTDRRIRKEWESKPAQQFSNRSKSRCLILSPGQDYSESEIYEPCSSMGLHEVRAPNWQILLPSFTWCNPKKRTGVWHRTTSRIGWCTGLGRERGCPNTEMPRMERECPRKSPASPANAMGTLCSALKVGYFAAKVKVSCERGQKSETRLLGLTFSNIKLLHLRCQLFCHKNIQKCPQKSMLGFWATPSQSLGTIRNMVLDSTISGQPHVQARAAQAGDEACST